MSIGSKQAITLQGNSNILQTAKAGARSMTNDVSTALKGVAEVLPDTNEALTYPQLAAAVANTALPAELKAAVADLAKPEQAQTIDRETYNKFAFNMPGSSALS